MRQDSYQKKLVITLTIFVYFCTSIIQYFIEGFGIFATKKEDVNPLVNVVAVFVDDKIYEDIEKDIKRYATEYVQKELDNTKALVLPINLENIHAYELYRILENIYFEGIEKENSNLIGTILIGDIPLPVINQNGYIFPSIYPYVDFLEQKYIRNEELQYFVPNNNTAGQAEIRHGIINYKSDIDKYRHFFGKIKTYQKNPQSFVGDYLWYEDFIANKNNYLDTSLEFYENKILFTEDIGYLRYNPLMLSIFQDSQNKNNNEITVGFKGADGKDLQNAPDDFAEGGSSDGKTAKITDKSIKEGYLKNYADLFSTQNAIAMRDNAFAGGRFVEEYINAENTNSLKANTHSTTTLIGMKDMFNGGTDTIQGLLFEYNKKLEDVVEENVRKNAMDIVIPVEFEEKYKMNIKNGRKGDFEFLYRNYFFGQLASSIFDAKNLSIFRGTFRNLSFDKYKNYKKSDLEQGNNAVKDSKDTTNLSLKSVGASFDIFATQTEANRAYNMMNMQTEYENYNKIKKHKRSKKECSKWGIGNKKIFRRWCKKYKYEPVGECNPGDGNEENDKDCETFDLFAGRNYGGYSPLNLNNDEIGNGIYEISGYQDYKRARRSIFDIAGQKKIDSAEWNANSYQAQDYGSLLAQKYAHLYGARKKYANETVILDPTWEGNKDPKTNETLDGEYYLQLSADQMNFFENASKFTCNGSNNDITCKPTGGKTLRITKKLRNGNGFPEKGPKDENGYYKYKTISSVVTNTETTYEHYHGLDTTKYATGGVLYTYNQDLQSNINSAIQDLNDFKTYFSSLNKKLQNFNNDLDKIIGDSDIGIKVFVKNINDSFNNLKNIKGRCEAQYHDKTIEITNEDGTIEEKIEQVFDGYTFKGNIDINNLKRFENQKIFTDRLKVYYEAIMFLYDESKVFQDTLDSFRSFDVENVIQTISFIFSKEEADLPLDFKDTWISEIKKEINELITLYETTFKEYENLFGTINSLKNTIESIPEDFSNNMPKFEETLKEINNWECSSSASGLVSEIKILSGNFYTADWEHENNFLSGGLEYFLTLWYPVQDEDDNGNGGNLSDIFDDEEGGEEYIDGVIYNLPEYQSHYEYIAGEIQKLDEVLNDFESELVNVSGSVHYLVNQLFYPQGNCQNNNSINILTFCNGGMVNFLQSITKDYTILNNLNTRKENSIQRGIQFFTIVLKDYAKETNLFISWMTTLYQGLITLEKFNELLMHFNAFPGEKELSNYQKYNYSNDIYRGLVEKLYTQISTVKNKQKKIKNEFTNLYNEIQKIFTSLNNVHKLTNGKPREEYYNNIFSDLKQLEIYAKTGACTIMRTRRQNACELIVSSGKMLSQKININLTELLDNIVHKPGANLLKMVTGDCNFIKSQGSTKRNLSGLQILDKELTGTLETLVTTGIKEIKQIYNIRTGQVETCQKNFNDSRKSQKTDCTSNFDSVCVNWADQTWSGEFYKDKRETCQKERYNVCINEKTLDVDGKTRIRAYTNEECENKKIEECKKWDYYINNYEISLNNCKNFCSYNYELGINNYNHRAITPGKTYETLINNQLSSFSQMYNTEMNRPTKWKKEYGEEETRTDGKNHENESITCNEIKTKYEACQKDDIFTYQKDGYNTQSIYCNGDNFNQKKCAEERNTCEKRWKLKKEVCFNTRDTASGYFFGTYQNKRTKTENANKMELDKCINKANNQKENNISSHLNNFSGSCLKERNKNLNSCSISVKNAQNNCLSTRTEIINNCTNSGENHIKTCQNLHQQTKNFCNTTVKGVYTGQFSTQEQLVGNNKKEQEFNCTFQEIIDHCEDYYTKNTLSTSGNVQCKELIDTTGMDCEYPGLQCNNYYSEIVCNNYYTSLSGKYYNIIESFLSGWINNANKEGRTGVKLEQIFTGLSQKINTETNSWSGYISSEINDWNNKKIPYAICEYPDIFPMSPIYKLMEKFEINQQRKKNHPYNTGKIQYFYTGYTTGNGNTTGHICPILYQTGRNQTYNCEPDASRYSINYYTTTNFVVDSYQKPNYWYDNYEMGNQGKERYEYYYLSGQSSDDCTGCINIKTAQDTYKIISGAYHYQNYTSGNQMFSGFKTYLDIYTGLQNILSGTYHKNIIHPLAEEKTALDKKKNKISLHGLMIIKGGLGRSKTITDIKNPINNYKNKYFTGTFDFPRKNEYKVDFSFTHENVDGVTFTGEKITKDFVEKFNIKQILGNTTYRNQPEEEGEEGYNEKGFLKLFNETFKSAPDSPVHITGMNILTIDKAIDSPRYITFQSIADTKVKFIYPNLFKVEVYKLGKNLEGKNVAVLKTIPEIKTAIKTYLKNQVDVYNNLLTLNENNNNSNKNAGYRHLKSINRKATPYEKDGTTKRKNTRFKLSDLENALGGEEGIQVIAELLYYQNLMVSERAITSTVSGDLQEIRDNFDINNTIPYILENYLVANNTKSPLVIPSYQNSGYEVAYFNSDGEDYIFAEKETPLFDNITTKGNRYDSLSSNKTKVSGIVNNGSSNIPTKNIDNHGEDACNIPMEEGLLIFKIDDMSSPWLTALNCWIDHLKESVKVEFNFNESLGPVVVDTSEENLGDALKKGIKNYFGSDGIGGEIDSRKNNIKQFGEEMNALGDSLAFAITREESEDVATEQMNIEKQNEKNLSKYPTSRLSDYQYYLNLRLKDQILQAGIEEQTNLTVNSNGKNIGVVKFEISASGEGCQSGKGISINGKEICKIPISVNFQPHKGENFVIQGGEKSGKSLIKVKACIPGGNAEQCITKSVILETKASFLTSINIGGNLENIYAGFGTILEPKAKDTYGNQIGATKERYTLKVDTGTFEYQGIKRDSLEIDNFGNLKIPYIAPKNITKNTTATITLQDKNSNIIDKKSITIKPLSLIIKIDNTKIFENEPIQEKVKEKLSFTLGKNPNDHQSGIISLEFKNNNSSIPFSKLFNTDTPNITIATKSQGLVFDNGEIVTNSRPEYNDTLATLDYIIGETAGNDILYINIPGYEQISLPIEFKAGSPYTAELEMTTNTVKPGEEITATITLKDAFGNTNSGDSIIRFNTNEKLTSPETKIYKNGDKVKFRALKGGIGIITPIINNTLSPKIQVNINQSFLPLTGLNVMYANYFGSDWGNQRGYFSNHNQYLENVMSKSEKMISATTQLINEKNIKQIVRKIDSDFTIQNLNNYEIQGAFFEQYGNKKFEIGIGGIGSISFNVDSIITQWNNINAIERYINEKRPGNTIFFLANEGYQFNDYIIENNEGTSITNMLNGITPITFTENKLGDYQIREVGINGEYGKLLFYFSDFSSIPKTIQLSQKGYFTDLTFEKGTSDKLKSLAIFNENSTFNISSSYLSIQNSNIQENAIGFLGDFKNISLFSEGQSVGESTIPYGSELLINIGDPILKRKTPKNHTISGIKYDGGLGKQIFTTPGKNIFKTMTIDFNADSLRDLLIIYTDGTVKLAKNYGVEPYFRNLENLLFIASDIDDVFVGDVDGNGYEDIIIKTTANQLRIYTNEGGKFDVDGVPVCLNINVKEGEKSDSPMDISKAFQIFLEDMDKDNILDIITNDYRGYVKIFYGGSNKDGANFLSKEKTYCDEKWYERQKNNSEKIIDYHGLKIDSNIKIVDESMVHRKGLKRPNTTEINDVSDFVSPETLKQVAGLDVPMGKVKVKDMDKITSKVENTQNIMVEGIDINAMTAAGVEESLKYKDFTINLLGEGEATHTFIPISYLENEKVSIYKTYKDINGGNLEEGDIVIVNGIVHANEFFQGAFGDIISGPWTYEEKSDIPGVPTSFKFNQSFSKNKNILVEGNDVFTYFIENIELSKGNSFQFSYNLKYTGYPVREISIKDLDGKDFGENFINDKYKDIVNKPQDGCVKVENVLLSQGDKNKRGYTSQTLNLQKLIDKTVSTSNDAENATQDFAKNALKQDEQTTENLVNTSVNELQSILDAFGNAFLKGESLNIGIGSEQFENWLNTNIVGQLQDVAKGLCNGFTFGGKNSCKGLPIPFNQAFLGPGDYHLFGCIQLPPVTQTLGRGLPVFHFPGTIYVPTPVGAVPSPFPWGMSGPGDDFLWAKGGTYPSMVRIYVMPTLTAQVGIALCMGPYAIGKNIPEPFGSLGGNCVLTVIKPQCKGGGDGATTEDGEENFEPYIQELQGNVCETKAEGPLIQGKNKSTGTYSSTPFKYSFTPNERNSSNINSEVQKFDGEYLFGFVNINVSPETTTASAFEHQDKLSFANIEAGGAKKNKITSSMQQGIRKILIDNWLDPQIRYIMNNLSRMSLTIKWPELDQYGKEVENIVEGFSGFIADIKESSAERKRQKQEKKAEEEKQKADGTQTEAEKEGIMSKMKNFDSSQFIMNTNDILSNPFELLSQNLSNNKLLSIGTKTVTIRIPMISTEDINGYNLYLLQWLNKNSEIIGNWQSALNYFLPFCFGNVGGSKDVGRSGFNLNDYHSGDSILEGRHKKEKTGSTTGSSTNNEENKDEKSDQSQGFGNIQEQKKTTLSGAMGNCTTTDLQNLQIIADFIKKYEQLQDQVYRNIQILQQYRDLPFQLYEWIHVLDRYINEITNVLTNFLGYFSYWMNANANRYKQYVDAIILIISTIRSYQVLIDFSANWGAKCSTCTNDNYDQYSCKLSFLCDGINLPILQIPNFKLPNITLDFSDVNLGMSILLPSFSFQTIKVDLPQLPDLPQMPDIGLDLSNINLADFQKKLKLIYKLTPFIINSDISIPELPAPPTLPELPSFIPNVDIELPLLPPAPAIPKLPSKFESILSAFEKIGKIYCKVKQNLGLVAEGSLKAKVEQLTQRTYEVPRFDNIIDLTDKLRLEAKNSAPVGFDIEIASHVNLQIDSSIIYAFLDGVAKNLNQISYKVKDDLNKKSQELSNKASEATYQMQDWTDEKTAELLEQASKPINETIDKTQQSLAPLTEPIDKAQQKLQEGMDKENQKGKSKVGNGNIELSMNDINEQLLEMQEQTSDELEYVDYETAKARLLSALKTFDYKTSNNTELNDRIKKITKEVQHNITINPNIKGIEKIETEVKNLINQEKEKILLAENLLSGGESIDSLLAYLDGNEFTAKENMELAYSTPFFTTTNDTIQILNSLENPLELILDNKLEIVNGYLNALKNHNAEQLQISQSDYMQKQQNLQKMKEGMIGIYKIIKQKNPTLLAYKENGEITTEKIKNQEEQELKTLLSATNNNTDTTTSSLAIDPSAYIKGIFVKNNKGSLTKAVYSEKQTNKIGTQYLELDVNNDGSNELLLRDKNTIYLKYGDQNEEQTGISKSEKTYYKKYYMKKIPNFENKEVNIEVDDTSIRIFSPLEEVKNFKIKSQSFDSISFSRMASQSEDVVGYLISFENRIDLSPEKNTDKTIGKINPEYGEYLLVLDQSYDYSNNSIKLKNGKIKNIEQKLKKTEEDSLIQEKEILEIRTYNASSDTIQAGIENIERKWKYARITTLREKTTNEGEKYLEISSPWSNQMVAGRQILGDDKGPEAIVNLIRRTTKEIVGTGEDLEGNVGTYYDLKIAWEDNVALKSMMLEHEGEIINSKETKKKKDEMILQNIFFDELGVATYQASAKDHFDNENIITINIEIKSPDITVVNIEETEEGGIITSELSEDIDEGQVSFARERNSVQSPLIGKKGGKEYSAYPISTTITTVSGAYYDLSNLIGLYSSTGELLATINPEDGELKILTGYQDKLGTKVIIEGEKLTTPIIQVFDKKTSQTLFSISFPIEEVIAVSSPTKKYQQKTITEENTLQTFIGGQDLFIDKTKYFLVSPEGALFSTHTLEGEYQFSNGYITYLVGNTKNEKDIAYQVKIQPFQK